MILQNIYMLNVKHVLKSTPAPGSAHAPSASEAYQMNCRSLLPMGQIPILHPRLDIRKKSFSELFSERFSPPSVIL